MKLAALLGSLCALFLPALLSAAPVVFSSATATFDQGSPYTISTAIDGVTTTTNGWGVNGGQMTNQTAIFTTSGPVTASKLVFTLTHGSNIAGNNIQEFRLSVTADAVPSLASTWTVLTPNQLSSSTTTLAMVGDHIRSTGTAAALANFRITTPVSLPNITGVRLELFPYDYAADALAASLGRSATGTMILTEFKAEADPDENLALYRPITNSAALIGGYPVTNVVDGNATTFTHPNAASGNTGFFYEIDLGATYYLTRIVLRNRHNCCPERLSNDRISVLAPNATNNGSGAQNWSAVLRADGSNSGQSGVDTMTATSPGATGTFVGRYIRVTNINGAGYNPQIAEVEVYGTQSPLIQSFTADRNIISSGQTVTFTWQANYFTTLQLMPGNIPLTGLTGSHTVTPTASTTYSLVATNASGSTTKSVNIGVDVTLLPPVINEFVAENDGGLKDEDDSSPDWIELRNPNPYGMDIGGFYLTTKPGNPLQWRIPDGVIIPENGYVVIFASAKNRGGPTTPLHTNFKLSNSGEYLALIARDGATTLQSIPSTYPTPTAYPAQYSNISYGTGQGGNVGYMKPSTPGVANGVALAEVAVKPTFSVQRGFYSTPQTVALTSIAGATIRYTTDASPPSETNGTIYNGTPLTISATTTLRAMAYKAGAHASTVETHTYLFLDTIITNPVFTWANGENPTTEEKLASLRDLPSVSIVTNSTLVSGTGSPASIEWLRPDGMPGFQENCGVETYGNSVNAFAKKSMRVKFQSAFGATKLNYPLFEGFEHGLRPATSFDAIDLRSGSHDMRQRGFYMANVVTDDTMLETGTVHPHGRFVHVYMNGVYHGMYHLREHWDANLTSTYLGGLDTEYETINGNANIGVTWDAGSIADGDGTAWANIKALRSNFEGIKPYLDVKEYTDWMVMWMTGRCEGEYRIGGPKAAGSGFKIFLNDGDGWFKPSDSTWDGWGSRTVYTTSGAPTRKSGDGPGDVFSGLFLANNPDHRVFLMDRIYKAYFNDGHLTPNRIKTRLQSRLVQVEKAIRSECARWYSNSATNFRTFTNWKTARDSVLNGFIDSNHPIALGTFRTEGFYPTLAANLEAPILSQQGGTVASGVQLSFTGPAAPTNATIYYTTDGSDPRLPGGNISPTAQLFTVGVSAPMSGLMQNTLLKARHKNGANWSALNEAFFQVGAAAIAIGDVAISELHFNPPGDDITEFVELLNTGTRAVNLRGCSLTGINYTFSEYYDTFVTPGQRLVVVKDIFAFQQYYGTTIPIAGTYDGDLNNGGESIALLSPTSAVLDQVLYDGAKPWPTAADGAGFSMTLARPELAHTEALAWRTSAAIGGTPGTSDATTFAGNPNTDADGDGLNALLEYSLGTSDTSGAAGPNALVPGIDVNGSLTVTLPLNLRSDDVTRHVEYSTDLLEWFPATRTALQTQVDGTANETWIATPATTERVYLRCRVVLD